MNETTVAFLQAHPLPPELAPFEPAIKQLPMPVVISLAAQGEAHGFTYDEMGESLKAAAEFGQAKQHRCATCLSWAKKEDVRPIATALFFEDDSKRIVFFAICEKCGKRIDRGRCSEEMARNLRTYGLGGGVNW